MQTPYKKILVYDLETGGLNSEINPITELAIVAVNADTLEIVEEFSVMLKPRLDLSYRTGDPIVDAKNIFKNIATKDIETNIKSLKYKGEKLTLKNLKPLSEDIEDFYDLVDRVYEDNIISLEDIKELESGEYKDIIKVFFDNSYNPEALAVTKISRELMEEEGVDFEEAFLACHDTIKRHSSGNNKPILSGHNIDRFDNPFLEKFYKSNKLDLYKFINELTIDTLKWARLKWYELPSYSLGVCANEVGLTLKEAHRALPDTIANAKFLIKIFKSLRGNGSKKTAYKRKKFNFNY